MSSLRKIKSKHRLKANISELLYSYSVICLWLSVFIVFLSFLIFVVEIEQKNPIIDGDMGILITVCGGIITILCIAISRKSAKPPNNLSEKECYKLGDDMYKKYGKPLICSHGNGNSSCFRGGYIEGNQNVGFCHRCKKRWSSEGYTFAD